MIARPHRWARCYSSPGIQPPRRGAVSIRGLARRPHRHTTMYSIAPPATIVPGANDDARPVRPGETLTLLDASGAPRHFPFMVLRSRARGVSTQKLVLRIYGRRGERPGSKRQSAIFSAGAR